MNITSCKLCPRMCGVPRTDNMTPGTAPGFCRMGSAPVMARAMLHKWEEPCISGTRGSGAVFFTGCTLDCVFCQNYPISHEAHGLVRSEEQLSRIMEELVRQGAHNLNLVSATPFVPAVLRAMDHAELPQDLPVVFNCGGYERRETVRALKGSVTVYLPDLKYVDPELSEKYSGARDYFDQASRAIDEMLAQTGPVELDENGIMKKGVMIRHLVLPGCSKDSVRVVEEIASRWGKDVWISLMAQYLPMGRACEIKALNRRITSFEYNRVSERAMDLGLTRGYMQQRASSVEEYIPDFSFQGLDVT